jgi:hypothetical protein
LAKNVQLCGSSRMQRVGALGRFAQNVQPDGERNDANAFIFNLL